MSRAGPWPDVRTDHYKADFLFVLDVIDAASSTGSCSTCRTDHHEGSEGPMPDLVEVEDDNFWRPWEEHTNRGEVGGTDQDNEDKDWSVNRAVYNSPRYRKPYTDEDEVYAYHNIRDAHLAALQSSMRRRPQQKWSRPSPPVTPQVVNNLLLFRDLYCEHPPSTAIDVYSIEILTSENPAALIKSKLEAIGNHRLRTLQVDLDIRLVLLYKLKVQKILTRKARKGKYVPQAYGVGEREGGTVLSVVPYTPYAKLIEKKVARQETRHAGNKLARLPARSNTGPKLPDLPAVVTRQWYDVDEGGSSDTPFDNDYTHHQRSYTPHLTLHHPHFLVRGRPLRARTDSTREEPDAREREDLNARIARHRPSGISASESGFHPLHDFSAPVPEQNEASKEANERAREGEDIEREDRIAGFRAAHPHLFSQVLEDFIADDLGEQSDARERLEGALVSASQQPIGLINASEGNASEDNLSEVDASDPGIGSSEGFLAPFPNPDTFTAQREFYGTTVQVPPPDMSTKRRAEDYDADKGFVEVDSDHDEPRRSKKLKVDKSKKASKLNGQKGSSSGSCAPVPGGGSRADNGEEYWELSDKRRISVSSYNNKFMVNIREYYEQEGRQLPGKKGISLILDQFRKLITILPRLEAALKAKGETIPRPTYGNVETTDNEDDDEEEEENVKKPSKLGKKNFEETSDEDNGEQYWELSDKRRVTLSTFSNKLMINIREYYEKEGQYLPGKKGISLLVDQFGHLVTLLPHIEAVLKAKGEPLPRPKYTKGMAVEGNDDEQDEVEDGDMEEDGGEKGKNGKAGKKNFEETSEED